MEDVELFRFEVGDRFAEFSDSERALLIAGCMSQRAFECGLSDARGKPSATAYALEADWLARVKQVRAFSRKAKLTSAQHAFIRGWILKRPVSLV